ncbi:unnamed protein product [Hydatigera taeniaeformis]|uniref:Uncharacterized protein n=1 Tax=Hydatigena taeniaeformis TaxID=6205 RepID=A0A0R3WRK3_HYDTA|nr:unnamed protein product [Hydatigera taeniaeformis]
MPKILNEELLEEVPTISDESESPIDFANLLKRIKSVATILRDADLEFLANDAEEAASRILKTNLVLPQVSKSSQGCQTPAETRSVQSSTACGVDIGLQCSPVYSLSEKNNLSPHLGGVQSATGGTLSSHLKSLTLTLGRQQIEYEKQRLEMNQKELAFKSNLDAMVSQLRNLVAENANLRHQLASKDAQLTSLGRLVKRVTSKLSPVPFTRTPSAGDLLESPMLSTNSNTLLSHHTQLSPSSPTLLQCSSRIGDLPLTPRVVLFEGLEDIDNDNITSISAAEPRRCDSAKNIEGRDRSFSTSSLSSLRTTDMMHFQRGLASLDDQIAKIRDSLQFNG